MILRFGKCRFDIPARTLRCGGVEGHLSGKAFLLLRILLERRPRVVTREELAAELWPDTFVSDANLSSLVKEVRAAIGDDARRPSLIRTVHRVGYAFAGEVEELAQEPPAIDAIAVMRFVNLSDQPDLDYLAVGVSEGLINALSVGGGIRIAPRTASLRFSGDEDVEVLTRALKVRAVVSGRIRLEGSRLVVQCELVSLATQSQIWGTQLKGEVVDLQRIQDDLAREIATKLALPSVQRATRHRAATADAYQAYLKGRHHWNRRTLEGIERGIIYFQSAIDSDPLFAPAHAGLADSYIALASRDLLPPLPLFERAEVAARRALELDPRLAEAHASIGAISELARWDWVAAEGSFEEAVRLDPSYSTARTWFAQALAHRGEFERAVIQMDAALESDPISFQINVQMALVKYLARDWDGCESYVRRAFETNPYFEAAHFTLGLALEQKGSVPAAREELERSLAISKGEPHALAALAHLEGTNGDRDAARRHLRTLEELAASRHVSTVHFATAHLALGEMDAAVDWLQKGIESRSGWLVFLLTEPRFDALRGDRRFEALIAQIGFGR